MQGDNTEDEKGEDGDHGFNLKDLGQHDLRVFGGGGERELVVPHVVGRERAHLGGKGKELLLSGFRGYAWGKTGKHAERPGAGEERAVRLVLEMLHSDVTQPFSSIFWSAR